MALYNLKNPAVKRLMKEAEELREPTEEYCAEPLEDNLFEWHFTLRGPPGTDFDGGIYHGRISLPPEYPMKPPSIILLTPNGRFEVNKKICLSISGYHPETWQPSWSIRTALLALIGFFPTHGNGAIGSLDYTPEERKHLSVKSQNWKCPECGYIKDFLKKDSKLPEKNTEVLDVKLQKEYKITQPISSDGTDFLQEEDSEQENQSFSDINLIQSNGLENHAFLPPSATLVQNNSPTISVPRNRHFTLDQKSDHSQSFKLSETKIVKPDEIKHVIMKKETNYFYNFFSLLLIWVIVVILGILITRRLLY